MLFYLKQVKSIHLVFSCSLVSLLEFTRKLNEDGFKMSLPIAPETQWSPPPVCNIRTDQSTLVISLMIHPASVL